MSNYYSLARRRGKDNMGGFATKVVFSALDEMDTIKGLKTTTNPGDSVSIDGSHSWKVGKGAHEIYFTSESVSLKAEPQGEMGGMSKKVVLTGFYPGTSEAAAELDRRGGNDEFIVWAIDPNTKRRVQIGSEDFPATIKCAYDSAAASSGRKGFTFTIEASMLGITFYEGVITLAPEALNSGNGVEDAETYVS
jgi:hypothetical protein